MKRTKPKNQASPRRSRATSWAESSATAAESKSPKSDKAYSSLIRLLSKRDYSEFELSEKLKRWYTEDAVAEALSRARERNWLKDPVELAKNYTEILHRKGKGHLAVHRALKKRGLPAIDRNGEREIEKAKALLAKKFPSKAKLTLAERQKAYRYLAYRGFDSEAIRAAMSSVGVNDPLQQSGEYEEL